MANVNQNQLLHFKRKLRDRSNELRGEIRASLERSKDETHAHIAEQARDLEDDSFSNLIVDVNLAEVERDADELRRISAALQRAADGRYGLCEDCDSVIPVARLDAEPTALRCVRCQEVFEKTHAGTATPRL